MTTLLPAEVRCSRTFLWTTVPARREHRPRCRAEVKDAPALPGYELAALARSPRRASGRNEVSPATHRVLHGGESPPVGSGLQRDERVGAPDADSPAGRA